MADTPQIPIFCGTFTIADASLSPVQYLAVDASSSQVRYYDTLPTDGSEVFSLYFVPWTNANNQPNPVNNDDYFPATQNFGVWLIASKLTGGYLTLENDGNDYFAYANGADVSLAWLFELRGDSDQGGHFLNPVTIEHDFVLTALWWSGNEVSWYPMSEVDGQLGHVKDSTGDSYALTSVFPGVWTAMGDDPSTNLWTDADFSWVDLRGTAQFQKGAVLNWGNANLSHANLSGMNLAPITIGNAVNLSGANLSDTEGIVDLSQATLTGANFSNVNLSYTLIASTADLSNCNFTCATFGNNQLQNANFTGATLDGVDCTPAAMPNPGAGGAYVFGQGSAATAATFNSARNAKGLIQSAVVNASMFGSSWSFLSLIGATIYVDAPITGVNCENVVLDGATVSSGPAAKGGAVLHSATFQNASMQGTSLSQADLAGSSFVNALLYGAHLDGANLGETTWSSAYAGCKAVFCTLSNPASGDSGLLNSGTIPPDLYQAMTTAGANLKGATVVPRIPSSRWLITTTEVNYEVLAQNGALVVLSYDQTPASFVGAFFINAVLDNGNFAQANFNGIQWIGVNASGNADFEGADLSSANISSLVSGTPDLSGAILYGVSFDDSLLINAGLSLAFLGLSADQTANSFVGANLFQACMNGTDLNGVNLSNAVVEVSATGTSPAFYGAPLFSMPASLIPSLNKGGSANGSVLAAFPPCLGVTSATVKVIDASTQWALSTQPAESGSPGVVWSAFMILSQNSGSNLLVYGTAFTLYLAVFGSDKPQAILYTAGPPAQGGNPQRPVWLEPEDMTATTTCPDGLTWAKSKGLTWDVLMTPQNICGEKIAPVRRTRALFRDLRA